MFFYAFLHFLIQTFQEEHNSISIKQQLKILNKQKRNVKKIITK